MKSRRGASHKQALRATSNQQQSLDLFGAPSYDPAPLKAAIKAAIRASGKSYDQVADLMSGYLARKISADEIYTWTGPSKENRMPRSDELEALTWATRSPLALGALGRPSGMAVITRDDAQLLAIAALDEQRAAIDEELATLRAARKAGRK